MFCTKCGFKIGNDAVFCPGCGTKVAKKDNTANKGSSTDDSWYYVSGTQRTGPFSLLEMQAK